MILELPLSFCRPRPSRNRYIRTWENNTLVLVQAGSSNPREFGRIFKHGRLGYVCEGRRNPDVTGVPGQIRLMEKTHGDDIGSH